MALVRFCEKCGKFYKQGDSCGCYSRPARRDKDAHDFYLSYEWKRLAMTARHRANYTDEYLLLTEGKCCEGNVVHHIYPVKDRPELKADINNLVVLSKRTHDLIHEAYKKGSEEKKKMIAQLLRIRERDAGV